MAGTKRFSVLRIIICILFLLVVVTAGCIGYLSHNYKQLIMQRLPAAVIKSTDSVYHISLGDISISFFDHSATITDLKLWPDLAQAAALQQQRRHTPPTLSAVSIPRLYVTGISWFALLFRHSLNMEHAQVTGIKWLLVCQPVPGDSSFSRDKKNTPAIGRVTCATVSFTDPDFS